MYDRMQTFTTDQITRIHDASMVLLSSVGVAFNETRSPGDFHIQRVQGGRENGFS